ncbi:hypothetical protein, partial [Clostridioides difficile]|uniref:hypothetical protein n=1 Tax=Clostridioides difficile TaxID=1496 RepID=UPI0021158245
AVCYLSLSDIMMSRKPLSMLLDLPKLTGFNFTDWLKNLKLLLALENLKEALEVPKPEPSPVDAPHSKKDRFDRDLVEWMQRREIWSFMVSSMSPKLQDRFQYLETTKDIMNHLRRLFGRLSRDRYRISGQLFRCRMKEGADVVHHAVKMIH